MRRAGLTALVALPILALGAVSWPTLLLGLVSSVLLLVWTSLRKVPSRPPDLVEWALFGIVVFSLAQLVPLPSRLHAALSPESHRLWAVADHLRTGATRWRPLSVDPPGTAFAALTGACTAATYHALRRWASDRTGRRDVLGAVVMALLVVLILELAHPLSGLTAVYGFYTPHEVNISRARVFGPLLNPNHAAAAACVLPPILLGWAMQLHSAGRKLLCFVGAVTSSAVAVLALSRGGMAVLVIELLVVGGFALSRPNLRRYLALIAAAALSAVGLALYVAFSPVLNEASGKDVTKLRTALRALDVFRDYRWTGAGRGTFGSVFIGYQQPPLTNVRFAYVESWPVQLLVDVGWLAAIVFVALLGTALYRSIRRLPRRPLHVGVAVALLGLILHDLFDFSLEFLGMGTVLAALWAWVSTARDDDAADNARARPWTWIAVPGALLVTAAVCLPSYGHAVEDDAAHLSERWARTGLFGISGEVDEAWDRHPAEPMFPMMKAILASDDRAASLFVHAVKLGPTRPQTHFWFARWFWAAGRRGQALAEYRQAVSLSEDFRVPVLRDVIRARAPLVELFTVTTDPISCDDAAAELVRAGRGDDAHQVDLFCIASVQHAHGSRIRVAKKLAATDPAAARSLLDAALAEPTAPPARIVIARADLEVGVEAERVIEQGLKRQPEDATLLEELVRRRGIRLGAEAVRQEFERFRSVVLSSSDIPFCRVNGVLGDIAAARSEPARALTHYLDAGLSRDGVEFLEKAAVLAEQLGELGVSEGAWLRLQEYFPDEPRFRTALKRVAKRKADRAHGTASP